jgi:hypothetical protein
MNPPSVTAATQRDGLGDTRTFVVLFKSGPLSWDGLIADWTPLGVWVPWSILTMWLLLRVIRQQESEGSEITDAIRTVSMPLADRAQ